MAASVVKLASWVLLALLLSADAVQGLRILGLFPLPGKSHFIMCESLMRNLAKRGHQVDVYSHFPLREPVANYTDYSLSGSYPILSNNLSYNIFKDSEKLFSISRMMMMFGTPICELMNLPIFQKLLHEPPNDPAYDIVIIESFVANCYIAWGRHLNVPVAVVVTTTLYEWLNDPLGNPSNAAVEPSVFSSFSSPMTFFQRMFNLLITTFVKVTFQNSVSEQDALVKKLFGSNYPNMKDIHKEISLVLLNYHHSLNGIRSFVPAIVPVGGLHIIDNGDKLTKEVEKFLDESKHGFIYFSFGSMVRIETFPNPILEVFYLTFKKIAPVRVLLKIAKPEELPPGLPSNVLTQSWFPQITVLKHKNIKAFITHGGLMGTQESIYYGVPMIAIPLFGDQFFNSESYAQRKIAIKIDLYSITEEILTKAVTEVLNNPIYKKSVDQIGSAFRDTSISSADKASFWIEYIARHGKDVLKSPTVDMFWWQVCMLDVYGFIALVVLIILYSVKVIVKKINAILTLRKRKSKVN